MNVDAFIRWVFPAVALACIVIEVVAGPLVLGIITYRMSADAVTQYIGGEVVTLIAAIAVMVSAFFERSSSATLIGAGASLYIIYTMVSVVFGQDYHRYDGTAEKWFFLFVVATMTMIPVAGRKTSLLLRAGVPEVGWLQRGTLIGFALLFAFLWISAILTEPAHHSPEYLADPALFWLIKFLDLAVVVPVGLLCAAQWTGTYRTGGLVVLSFTVWIMLAIAGMQIAVVVSSPGNGAGIILAITMIAGSAWSSVCLWYATKNWNWQTA